MKRLQVLIGGAESIFSNVSKVAQLFWGCDVLAVADGKQACAALASRPMDICILDWDLSRMSGLEACHWIRSVELKTQPYVILLTEKGRLEQRQAAYMAGANDYLAKPFNMEDLHFLISTFDQRISRQNAVSHEIRHVDPLELYRRDLAASKGVSRL